MLGEAAAHGLEVECLVFFIECILDPESELSFAFVEADASVQGTVNVLADIVLFGPVDAAGS